MTTFSKNKTVAIVLSVVAGALIIGGAIGLQSSRAINNNPTPVNPKTLDGQIQLYSQAISANKKDIKNYISLSQAYLQKVRETADIAYYTKIDELMAKAEKIDPNYADVAALRSSVAIGRHYFADGKKYAEKAIALNPNDHLYYGLLGDAEIELGQYEAAASSFQKMADMRPGYSSYIRIAYIRELYGDIEGAKSFLQLAIDSGSSFKENIAFAHVELGKLNMRTNLEKAGKDFATALIIVPDYPPALQAMGKVAFFENKPEEAETYFKKAYEILPIAAYATDLADLYMVENKSDLAKQYLTLAQITYTKSATSGINTDLEESLFLSNYDLTLDVALQKAERAHTERPSIYTADFYAWALYKNGKIEEAMALRKEAFALGENDPLILFHQGMIAAQAGDKAAAKKYLTLALKTNPYFSMLDVGIAKETLKQLK